MAFIKFENLGNGVKAVKVNAPGGTESSNQTVYFAGDLKRLSAVGNDIFLNFNTSDLPNIKINATEVVKNDDTACVTVQEALQYLSNLNFKMGGGGQGNVLTPPQYSSVLLTGSSNYIIDGNTAVYYVDTSAGDVTVNLSELPENNTTRIIKIVNTSLSGSANTLRVNLLSGNAFAGQSFTSWFVWQSDSVEFLGAKPTGLPTNWGISSDPEASFKKSIEDPILGAGTYIDNVYSIPLPIVLRNDNNIIFQVINPTDVIVNLSNYRRLKIGYYVYFEDTGFSSGWSSEVWLENNGLEVPATRTEFRNFGQENASHIIYESVTVGDIDVNFPIILKARATGTTSNSITICRLDVSVQV